MTKAGVGLKHCYQLEADSITRRTYIFIPLLLGTWSLLCYSGRNPTQRRDYMYYHTFQRKF
jgi:hypothetical protein